MPDMEFLKWAAAQGLGTLLALVMFWFHRRDAATAIEQWRGQTGILVDCLNKNTGALVEMKATLDALHRRIDAENAARGGRRNGDDPSDRRPGPHR